MLTLVIGKPAALIARLGGEQIDDSELRGAKGSFPAPRRFD